MVVSSRGGASSRDEKNTLGIIIPFMILEGFAL